MLLEALEYALRAGCNSSLATMIQSQLFRDLFAKHNAVNELPADSDERVAARAGHNRMGVLFNNKSVSDALAEARANPVEDPFSSSAETRALTECLGNFLINAAETCLTDGIRDLARAWRSATRAEQQIEIARQLYFELRSEDQEARGELTRQTVWDSWTANLTQHECRDDFLPALYGQWNKDTCPANCLGKSQMIAAFASLAGARTMSAFPLESAREQQEGMRNQILMEVLADVSSRNLRDADSSFCAALDAAQFDLTLRRRPTFHVGIALELCDGRWLLLDPHGLSWGVFGDQWQLAEVNRVLEKYRWALPGLQLTRHDGGAAVDTLAELASMARRLIKVSQDLGQLIKEREADLFESIELILGRGDFDFVMRLDRLEKGEELPEGMMDEAFRRYLVTVMFLGSEEVLWNPLSVVMDPEFLPKRIRQWLTFYHATALNLFADRLTNEGKLLHPVCDFGLTAYHIGVSVLNSVELCLPGGKDVDGTKYFLGHSFDQVTFYNAMCDPGYAQVALKSLQALPFVHPLCARRMAWQEGFEQWR